MIQFIQILFLFTQMNNKKKFLIIFCVNIRKVLMLKRIVIVIIKKQMTSKWHIINIVYNINILMNMDMDIKIVILKIIIPDKGRKVQQVSNLRAWKCMLMQIHKHFNKKQILLNKRLLIIKVTVTFANLIGIYLYVVSGHQLFKNICLKKDNHL